MATVKQVINPKLALAFGSELQTLASATYDQSTNPYDCTINQPTDVIVEAIVNTQNTTTGNKQLLVYIKESLDGSQFRSGPAAGTITTDEPNLKLIGAVPVLSSNGYQTATFSIFQTLGYVPAKFYVVVKNDMGVALSNCTISTAEVFTIVS